MAKKLTQRQIAKLVGVSQPVVSAILNGGDAIRCSEEKREEILKLARESGYRPNRQAIILREGRSKQIGLIQNLGYAEVSEQRAEALAEEVKRIGYRLMVSNAQWYKGREMEIVNQMVDSAMDGVLLSNTHESVISSDLIRELERRGIPVVSLSGTHEHPIPQVHANIAQNFYDLTMHCIKLGRKRLVLGVNGEDDLLGVGMDSGNFPYQSKADIQGFVRAIIEVGGNVSGPAWEKLQSILGYRLKQRRPVAEGNGIEGHILYSGVGWYHSWERPLLGRKLAERMCREYPDTDALICRSDDIAIGAMQYCVEQGIPVGETFSITGHDDTVAGRFSTIPLTTVRQPIAKMARQAVGILQDLMNGCISRQETPFIICDSDPVIVRRSCGAGREKQKIEPEKTL